MNMVAQPQTVFFHNTQLSIVEHNNQPYVPMKPVVEGMGLAWQAQYDKLKQPKITPYYILIFYKTNKNNILVLVCVLS